MNFSEFKSAVFSIIQENDPYRESKELQLRNWCYSFFELLTNPGPPPLPFVLDVLSEEDCWENTDSIHRIELNRRKVAKKMIQVQSWTGKANTLPISERFRIASWCCLGADVVALFDHYKRQHGIKNYGAVGLKWFAKKLNREIWSDPLTTWWLHILGGCYEELPLEDMHLYEYGLYLQLKGRPNTGHYTGYVEGVEFLWNKIESLPEHELNAHQKREIFMKTAVRAASGECANNPEIFEFCFSQISPDHYPEFIGRTYAEKGRMCIFRLLRYMRRFDYLQKLFDCLGPNLITEDNYRHWLKDLIQIQHSEIYANEAENLFIHIWKKEGFGEHRAFVLRNEMEDSGQQGVLLKLLITRNYMKAVWTIQGEASGNQFEQFLNSKHTEYIYDVLLNRSDQRSIVNFFVPD